MGKCYKGQNFKLQPKALPEIVWCVSEEMNHFHNVAQIWYLTGPRTVQIGQKYLNDKHSTDWQSEEFVV